jgi:hypothetical protein
VKTLEISNSQGADKDEVKMRGRPRMTEWGVDMGEN